jgi:hypothetical protein
MNGKQHGKGKLTLSKTTLGRAYGKREKECSGDSRRNLWLSEEQSKDSEAMTDGC